MTVHTPASTDAAQAAESALTQLRTLTKMATKLAATEEQLAVAMTDAAAMLPHRAGRLLALADEARTSAASWRAWALDPARQERTELIAGHSSTSTGRADRRRDTQAHQVAQRLEQLQTQAAELRACRGRPGPARLAQARQSLETAINQLHEVQLRYIESLDASAAAHDRAAASFRHALQSRLTDHDYEQRAQAHRAAAAADRDRASKVRSRLDPHSPNFVQ